jgi:hypothetical protein
MSGVRHLRLVTVLFLAACTASKANIQIVTAEETLRQARELKADRASAYEYVMAARYLTKAKEEAGYADYRVADALARQSAEWADRAIIATERRGRTDFDLDDFQEAPTPPAPTTPLAPVPPVPTAPTGLEDILGPSATPAPGEPAPAPPAPVPEPAPIEDPEGDVVLPGGSP